MQKDIIRELVVTILISLLIVNHASSQHPLVVKDKAKHKMVLSQMLGEQALMDSSVVRELLRKGSDHRIYQDRDQDGKIDVVYMIDTDDRHDISLQPLVVKIIDEDGDMYLNLEGDFDSDLYVADYHGNGVLDAAVDYVDQDFDNDVDEQAFYYWGKGYSNHLKLTPRIFPDVNYFALWVRGVDDDNLIWADVDYQYLQGRSQWNSESSGDMFIYPLFYEYEENTFYVCNEISFCHYDTDMDGHAEEAVRVEGKNFIAAKLRYSMDIDNDTRGRNYYNYDVSITCIGEVPLEPDMGFELSLRGISSKKPILQFGQAQHVAKTSMWDKAHLTWDENNNNIEGSYNGKPDSRGQPNERWEGILNHPNGYMPQVGGPSCSPFNKRNEVDQDYSGKMQLYFSPVDHRLHLYGAEVGWIKVDYDNDDHVDMFIWTEDQDNDGFFDTWKIDINGDALPRGETNHKEWIYDVVDESKFERIIQIDGDQQSLLPYEYWRLNSFYPPLRDQTIEANQCIIELIKDLLKKEDTQFEPDPLEQYFRTDLIKYGQLHHVGEKIKNSRDGSRYYQDLLRERYWHKLILSSLSQKEIFSSISEVYDAGDYAATAELLKEHFLAQLVRNSPFNYEKSFSIEIKNPSLHWLSHHPVSINVSDILQSVPDFNPDNYVLVESERLIDDRVIPSQVDDVNEDGKPDELVWLQSMEENTTTEVICHYSPRGRQKTEYNLKAKAIEIRTINDEGIGWESNRCAYRMFEGQIDFLGKRLEGLYLQEKNVHQLAHWGMDVLKIGSSSGIGGITIWKDGLPIPLMNPQGKGELKIETKILASGPVRSLVRVRFRNIPTMSDKFEVKLLMSSYAENQFSKQDIIISGSESDNIFYSPGIMKLPQEQWQLNTSAGTLANWGMVDHQIQEVGLGLIFPSTEYAGFIETELDRHVKLKFTPDKKSTHYIMGTWRKGRTYRISPDLATWSSELEALSVQLRTPILVTIEQK